jgi:Rad3-related DNA helicase
MNYPYLLAEANHAGGFGTRELLVLDEAHGVEAALMRFVEVRLSDGELARAGVEARLPQGDDAWGLLDGALDLVPALRARVRNLAAELETLAPTSGRAVEALRRRRWLDGALRGLDLLAESSDAGEVDWVVDAGRDADGRTLAFRPVDVAALAEPLLFRLGRRVLLMSATLLDAPTVLRSLGLDPDGVAVVRAPSTFPAERRPVRLRPAARLTRHRLAAELPRLVAAVAELMREHPTEKGVVHAHSYRIANAIEDGLPPDLRTRLRSHRDAGGRDAALAAHLDDDGPSVLLTPSMTEGIDLAGDAARWQAICKIPWPYLGDPQVAARRERDPGWYAWRACLTVVQAYGRSVRSVDDRAVTYLLDADFPAFLRRERARLPIWFVEAIDEAPAELG